MIQVTCMIQKDGGDFAEFEREFDAVPRIGDRVRLKGPEFGEALNTWQDEGLTVGESVFQVTGVDWDDRHGGAEVYLALEPSETTVALWCGCSREARLKWPTDPGEIDCPNCGRARR